MTSGLRFTSLWRKDVYDDERAVSQMSEQWSGGDGGIGYDSEDVSGVNEHRGCFWIFVFVAWALLILVLSGIFIAGVIAWLTS